jgi:hypothetical protein
VRKRTPDREGERELAHDDQCELTACSTRCDVPGTSVINRWKRVRNQALNECFDPRFDLGRLLIHCLRQGAGYGTGLHVYN